MKISNLSLSGFLFPALMALALVLLSQTEVTAATESPRQTVDRLYKFVFANDQNPRAKELPAFKGEFDQDFYESLLAAFNLPEAGLDFAPFTAAQDNVGAYRIGTPVIDENDALVPVSFGNKANPSVEIKLRLAGGKWLVEDVMYPGEKEPNDQLSKIIGLLLKEGK